ncbi:MAG: arginine--tRNA ligase [Patescibacteria group bacterium]
MFDISNKIKKLVKIAGNNLGLDLDVVNLEHPDDIKNGDYSTNVALAYAKALGKSPREIAEQIKNEIIKSLPKEISKVEVAGAGFINFYLSREFFAKSVGEIIQDEDFGKGKTLEGKMALFEYTDPNPFKAFHIGHLMANAVGETLSRIAGNQGAMVKRICYQGDIGLHVAKTVWAMQKMRADMPKDSASFEEKIKFMGDAYVLGTNTYDENESVQTDIKTINKKLFEKSDAKLQELYDRGREWSLLYFDLIYKKLGTKFDDFIFESEVAELGKRTVEQNIPNVFTESEGAVIFKGEDHGLHTRVFLNSQRLPTYEAKELGNAMEKARRHKFDISIITSASEIADYFKVLKCVMGLIDPENAVKTHFVGHGMLRFADGKMSSRKGNIITGESLIDGIKEVAMEKIEKETDDKEKISEAVAIAAIKYSILRQSPGKDIIFDKEKALSFEGDSGPYLQYAFVRTQSLLEKADKANLKAGIKNVSENVFNIEKFLYRFPEITTRAWEEKAPQLIVEYLTHLAGSFNNFYAQGLIISDAPDAPYKVAITKAFSIVMKRGLELLGIPVLTKM